MSLYSRTSHLAKIHSIDMIALNEAQRKKAQEEELLKQHHTQVNCQENINDIISHQLVSIFMTILTIYSIFAIDAQKAFLGGTSSAFIFSIVHVVAISIFFVEIILNTIAKHHYFAGFYFWIDIISTFTMVLEIVWIENIVSANSNVPVVLTFSKVIKASRLSKIGARTAKMMSLLIQFLKIKKQKEKMENDQTSVGANQSMVLKSGSQNLSDRFSKQQFEKHEIYESEQLSQQEEKREACSPNQFDLTVIKEEMISQKSSISEPSISNASKIELLGPILPHKQPNSKILNSRIIATAQDNTAPKNQRISKLNELSNRRVSALEKYRENIKNQSNKKSRKSLQVNSIVERLQKCLVLPPLIRPFVDAGKSEQIEQKCLELKQQEEQSKKNSLKEKLVPSSQEIFKLGEVLKEKIQINIIIMIMGLIIGLPLITTATWFDKDPDISRMSANYAAFIQNASNQEQQGLFQAYVDSGNECSDELLLLQIRVNDSQSLTYPSSDNSGISNLSDFTQLQLISYSDTNIKVIFDDASQLKITSILSLGRSLFITLLLIFSSLVFMNSINNFALKPLEKMCDTINKIALNPFESLKQINQQKEQNEFQDADDLVMQDLQTNILEKAIIQMTNVLVIGTGEIGSKIITSSIQAMHFSSDRVISAGFKQYGLFMYIKIRKFQSICTILEDKLVYFMNILAQQIHEIAIFHGGTPLENDGEGFMIFWEINHKQIEPNKSMSFYTNKTMNHDAEVQKIIQLGLRAYRQISRSISYLLTKKHNYFWNLINQEAETGYEQYLLAAGIHLGTAIEGSIGSNKKMSSKCLSSDIAFTKNLCKLAEHYQISNAISEQASSFLSDLEANLVRKIDYLESKDVMFWVYSLDMTLSGESHKDQKSKGKRKRKQKQKTVILPKKETNKHIYKKKKQLLQKITAKKSFLQMFEIDRTFEDSQKLFSKDFYETWNEALERFYSEQWEEARFLFQNMLQICHPKKDMNSLRFLNRMGELGSWAPKNWRKSSEMNFDNLI